MSVVSELSDKELVSNTMVLLGKEKEILHKLLLLFGEIDKRKLYRDEGYSSLFVYLRDGLGYSKAAAYRRFEAARFLRKRPELYGDLQSEALTFSSLVELAKCEGNEDVEEIIRESKGQSLQEVAKRVERAVAPTVKARAREKVRVVKVKKAEPLPILSQVEESEGRSSAAEPIEEFYEVSFQADEEFMALYQEAKAVAGGLNMKDVMKPVLKDFTKRNSPKEKIKRREARATRKDKGETTSEVSAPRDKQEARSRHIPEAIRDQVFVRDECRCTYVSPDGVRCTETTNLEVDHKKPFSLGGTHELPNLRLLCKAHNQLHAEKTLGKEFMEQFR